MRRPNVSGVVADVAVVLGGLPVLGGLCGVLWWLLTEPAVYTKVRGGRGAMDEVELASRFDADGWYAVVAVLAGFAAGMGLTWWRSRDVRLTTMLLPPAAAAAAAAMAVVGRLLGPGDADRALAAAGGGDRVPAELLVTADAAYLLWPIAALFGALMVLWSSPAAPEDSGPRIEENHERAAA